jgi:hypothetical protein
LRNCLIIVVDLEFELRFSLISHAVLEVVDRHGEVCVVASNVQELIGEIVFVEGTVELVSKREVVALHGGVGQLSRVRH